MKKLTEELKQTIFTQVMHSKATAEGPRQNYLTKWRNSALYEACKLPGIMSEAEKPAKGVDLYVEPVLRETIKEAKPQLLDSFTSDGRLAVSFRSRGWNKHTSLDELITHNLNKIVLDEQDGYAVIEKAINDALGAGSSFVKVYVDEKTTKDEASAEDWIALPDFMALLSDGWLVDAPDSFADERKGKVKGLEWKTSSGSDEAQPARLIRGTIPLKKTDRQIKLEFIESKDLWFDTSFSDDFDKLRYCCHRILTTVGEAEKMGFDPEKLKEAARLDKDEILQDLSLTGINDINQDDFSTDPKELKIYLYEHYTYSSQLDKKGESKLYQVIATGTEVLEVNEIPFIPFVHAKKKSIVGSFYGNGFYDEAKQYQDALTKKYRIIDHLGTLAAYPRYIGVKGGFDKQTMLNNRPGSIIEAQAVDAITLFPPVPLDNSFVKSYDMLRESEIKALRRGFGSANLEEIPPIAAATVAMGLYADAMRGMELSKSFARTLLTPLYKLIYETMRFEEWPLSDEQGQPVEGATYPSLYEFKVDINTAGDDAAQIMQLQNAVQTAAALTQIQGAYLTDQNRYEMLSLILTRADLDADKYLTNPATIPDDAAARQMQLELDALNHEAAKERLQEVILNNQLTAAKIYLTEQQADELILKGASDRAINQEESLTRQQQLLINNKEADTKATKVQVENKRVNYDAILGAHEKRHDNIANGVM